MNAPRHIARKRFGQHFLTDLGVIDALVRGIQPQPDDCMVEIGPGLSALTQPLLQHVQHLHVIEIDRDLAARLRAMARLTVHEADVLTVDFTQLARQLNTTALRVVGNLPYNISTPILFHLPACGRGARSALHAAKGGGRPHGGRALNGGLWPLERDAAMALRDGQRARCAARIL